MIELTIVLVCVFLNALLACFEMAFVTVTKPQLRQLAKTRGRDVARVLELRENPERTLSVLQIGITLVGMVSAAVGGAGAEESFSPYFESRFGVTETTSEVIAILIVVVPLTFVSVVFGELVPKAMALRYPVRISVYGARTIGLIDRFMSPIVSFLEMTTKFIMNSIPKRPSLPGLEAAVAVEIDHLSKSTQQYVLNLVSVEIRKVRDCMVDWSTVNSIATMATRDEVAATVLRSGHTRLPVINEGNRVVGLLHTKEFIALLAAGEGQWQELVRPVLEFAEESFALAALRTMQTRRSHMGLVVDRDRRPVGIITLEDIIEEIVGEIYDEDDDGRVRKLLSSVSRRRNRP